ncbi:MAG TPA: hypothetical protein VMZ28_14405 [Kofleriaceae bacterium]|nr:hypothetical protein [Kofleriaceae bacterium]
MQQRLTREIFARELIPARARWWMAAAGMRDWYAVVGSKLRPHLGDDSRALLSRLSVRMFERRYAALRETHPGLPGDERARALLMAGLYRLPLARRSGWILRRWAAGRGARRSMRAPWRWCGGCRRRSAGAR